MRRVDWLMQKGRSEKVEDMDEIERAWIVTKVLTDRSLLEEISERYDEYMNQREEGL
jgi:hypothetical protein